jgi:hypothetical protein
MGVIYTGPGRVDLVIRLVVFRAFLHGFAAFTLFSTVFVFHACFLFVLGGRDGMMDGGEVYRSLYYRLLLLLRYYRPCVHFFTPFLFYYWKPLFCLGEDGWVVLLGMGWSGGMGGF